MWKACVRAGEVVDLSYESQCLFHLAQDSQTRRRRRLKTVLAVATYVIVGTVSIFGDLSTYFTYSQVAIPRKQTTLFPWSFFLTFLLKDTG